MGHSKQAVQILFTYLWFVGLPSELVFTCLLCLGSGWNSWRPAYWIDVRGASNALVPHKGGLEKVVQGVKRLLLQVTIGRGFQCESASAPYGRLLCISQSSLVKERKLYLSLGTWTRNPMQRVASIWW
ncbi:hypothetical protein TraAM80_09081 [Trypanosoma rangeli]|uniref:Uncharacterized protein n=1 Tax=Trypanosoma rangeli TaxID=5698 RepID=A0A422MXG1_TRYRA|nr:uncharacterized protein TraAM80_09081 [Trypanosoma rangeli]RNE97893.1 hypothetical protein TraAM80_09081 [Trypanosoma rangeli]|eukprot:RNE97893.1 hypothetical protein TraAM80_09081 [Trypanosoma rangeli]